MLVAFTPTALRQWTKLHPQVRARLNRKFKTLAAGGAGNIKKLRGRAGSRLRVGDWRVIYYVEGDTIVVVAVGNRSDIYD